MKNVFMWLYGPLETDARVLRSIEAVLSKGYRLTIVTCNTSSQFRPTNYILKDYVVSGEGIQYYLYFVTVSLWYFFRNRKRFDLVYLQDYYSTLPGWFLSFFVNKEKLIYDAHELLVNPRRFHLGVREKLFVWFEKRLVNKVKWVIEANKERETVIRRLYKLHNTTNVMNISKYKKSAADRIFNPSEVTIVYQGAITESRNLSFFIEAIKELDPYIKLLFIGDGPSLNIYKSKVIEEGLSDRVTFTGRLSNEQMMKRLQSCTIGIISYSFRGLNNIYCSPNKIFEYAAIDLPFIATNQPFIEEISRKYNTGLTFKYGDKESFISNVKQIIKEYPKYLQQTNDFLHDYSYEKELLKLKNIL